jgi:hypothetical protein
MRYQNSIYYNKYDMVNQVFKGTLVFIESRREGVRLHAYGVVLCDMWDM